METVKELAVVLGAVLVCFLALLVTGAQADPVDMMKPSSSRIRTSTSPGSGGTERLRIKGEKARSCPVRRISGMRITSSMVDNFTIRL